MYAYLPTRLLARLEGVCLQAGRESILLDAGELTPIPRE
jgi:hypothetical protein